MGCPGHGVAVAVGTGVGVGSGVGPSGVGVGSGEGVASGGAGVIITASPSIGVVMGISINSSPSREILTQAVSGAITRDFNSIRTFNQLLNASSTAEQRYTFE